MEKLINALLLLSASLIAYAAQPAVSYPVQPQNPPTAQIYATGSVLRRVAACESTGDPNGIPRQFNADGSILWGMDASGTIIKRDCGEFQINTKAHADEISKLGLDVCGSQADNETYAMTLYRRNGLKDWAASQSCWNTSPTP